MTGRDKIRHIDEWKHVIFRCVEETNWSKWRVDRNMIAEMPEIDEKCLKIDFSYILESVFRYANSEKHEL
jgi:hypothetical protein